MSERVVSELTVIKLTLPSDTTVRPNALGTFGESDRRDSAWSAEHAVQVWPKVPRAFEW